MQNFAGLLESSLLMAKDSKFEYGIKGIEKIMDEIKMTPIGR